MSDKWLSTLSWTLAELEKLGEQYPGDTALVSSIRQVEYLIGVAKGQVADEHLEHIILGHHAMYSLADIVSNELSIAMCDISDHVRRELRRKGRIV